MRVGIVHSLDETDAMFVRTHGGGVGVWVLGQSRMNNCFVLRLWTPLGMPLPYMSSSGSTLMAVLLV